MKELKSFIEEHPELSEKSSSEIISEMIQDVSEMIQHDDPNIVIVDQICGIKDMPIEDKKREMVDAINNILSEIRDCPTVDPEIQKITNEHFWDMI